MCFLHIHAQSHSRILEVLPEETEYAELVVEDAVSHVLLKLFGEAMVDEVAVDFSAASHTGLLHCSIQIHAQCSCQSFTLPQHTKERMKLAVEEGTWERGRGVPSDFWEGGWILLLRLLSVNPAAP